LVPLCARAEGKLSLKTVSVDLPADERMFANEAGADAVNNNCLACHSADMVLNQPALSKAQWKAEVDKMRTAYKAPIDAKDIDPIVDYLVSIRGTK
jgi:mono/diheme cytochrome c family protein